MSEQRITKVPEYKKKIVAELVGLFKKSKTVLIASIKGLPDSQLQAIKKKLRGKAEIKIAKKTAFLRAITQSEKGALQHLKDKITADIVILFSDMDAFELSAFLTDNLSPAKAKAGDVAPEDINVEPGPTDLVPGPAISELSSVGLRVVVEGGKLAIKQGATVVKKGEKINEKVAGVLAKLNVEPMRVGLEPLVAYDSNSDKVYVGIKIDREKVYKELKESIAKALNLAVNLKILNEKTIGYFISKAGIEYLALEKKVGGQNA
jgi:large subunit ribosomal protein L10